VLRITLALAFAVPASVQISETLAKPQLECICWKVNEPCCAQIVVNGASIRIIKHKGLTVTTDDQMSVDSFSIEAADRATVTQSDYETRRR
jgi:hypothetical protein